MKRFVCLFLVLSFCFIITSCKRAENKKEVQVPENWEIMQSMILKPMDEVLNTLQIADDQLEELAPLHIRVLDYSVEYAGAIFELELNPSVMPDEEHKEKNSQYDYSELPVPEYPEEEFLQKFLYKSDCDNLEDALALMERLVTNYTDLLGEPDSENYLKNDPQNYFTEAEIIGTSRGPYKLEVIWDCTPDDIHALEYTTAIWIAQLYDEAGENVIGYRVSISFGCRMKPVVR